MLIPGLNTRNSVGGVAPPPPFRQGHPDARSAADRTGTGRLWGRQRRQAATREYDELPSPDLAGAPTEYRVQPNRQAGTRSDGVGLDMPRGATRGRARPRAGHSHQRKLKGSPSGLRRALCVLCRLCMLRVGRSFYIFYGRKRAALSKRRIHVPVRRPAVRFQPTHAQRARGETTYAAPPGNPPSSEMKLR